MTMTWYHPHQQHDADGNNDDEHAGNTTYEIVKTFVIFRTYNVENSNVHVNGVTNICAHCN